MFGFSRLNQSLSLEKTVLIIFLALILGRFMVAGMAKVLFNNQSSDGDESAYLALGLALREDGLLTDGTRPPLYPLLLTPVAQRDWPYFTWAKLITLGLGSLTVLATFIIGRQLFNWETGLLAAFLLAANKEFHLRASTVYADTLLVLLFVMAWYALIKSFEKQRYSYITGFLIGLAYLTKSSATLLLLTWGATALIYYRRRIVTQPQLWIIPVIFLVTSAPLLVYNWRNFGSPFYSFATSHVMWMDRWAESQVEDATDLPTLSSYFQTHTFADMIDRLRVGLRRLNPELMTTLIPSRTIEPAWLGSIGLAALALLCSWLLIFRRDWLKQALAHHRLAVQLFVFLFIPFYFFSAWYARVLIESRFLIPILGPFYLLIAAGAIGLLHRLKNQFDQPVENRANRPTQLANWGYPALMVIALGWGGWWLVATAQLESWSLTVDPFVSDRDANLVPEATLTWLIHDYAARGSQQATVVFGPSKSLPLWKSPPHFTFERIPVEVDTWADMERYIGQTDPDYIMIDSDTARRRRQALGGYFVFDEVGVEFQQVPPGWMLIYLSDDAPHTWAIFAPAAAPSRPAQVILDEQIELLGYDLAPSLDTDERTLKITLYWQALTAPEKDYTLFLHVTAPDGFVKAQRDQQPFNGLWPTSRWATGDLLADRYTIRLDDWLQPGEYLLLAGLYEPQSGQRLTPVNASPAPSPNAILLDKLTLK